VSRLWGNRSVLASWLSDRNARKAVTWRGTAPSLCFTMSRLTEKTYSACTLVRRRAFSWSCDAKLRSCTSGNVEVLDLHYVLCLGVWTMFDKTNPFWIGHVGDDSCKMSTTHALHVDASLRHRVRLWGHVCATGGEPSTWFPPEWLVEQENVQKYAKWLLSYFLDTFKSKYLNLKFWILFLTIFETSVTNRFPSEL